MSTQDFITEIENFRTELNTEVVNTDNLYLDLEIPELPSWLDVVQKELDERRKVLNLINDKHLEDLPAIRINATKPKPKKRTIFKKNKKSKNKINGKETELILPEIIQYADDSSNSIKIKNETTKNITQSNEPQLLTKNYIQDISDDSILTAIKTLATKQSSSLNLPIITECISKIKSKINVLKLESQKLTNIEATTVSKQDSIIEYINKFEKSDNLENLSNLTRVATKIRFLQNVLTDHGNKTFYYCAAPNFQKNNEMNKNKIRRGTGLNTVTEQEAESIFSDCTSDSDDSIFSDC